MADGPWARLYRLARWYKPELPGSTTGLVTGLICLDS